jgi:hypothetical protein
MFQRILYCFLFVLLTNSPLFAQVYKRSFGLRLDETSFGLSLVQRIARPVTIELIADFRQKDLSLALVPRIHGKLIGRRLNYFLGAGGQAGLVKNTTQEIRPFYGFGGMMGLEYKFHFLPIHISYDVRPLIQLEGHPDLFGFQSAFAIRIVLKSEKTKWKEKMKKWKEENFGKEDED